MLLALVFLAMGAFAYIQANKGPKSIKKGHYRMLFMVIAIALAVLVRVVAFVLE